MEPTIFVSLIHTHTHNSTAHSKREVFKSPFSMVSMYCWQLSFTFLQNIVKVILSKSQIISCPLKGAGMKNCIYFLYKDLGVPLAATNG